MALNSLRAHSSNRNMNAQISIRYIDGKTEVRLGDRVQARVFLFFKRAGRVVYVPGVSKLHREMEHDGVRLVGINFARGGSGGFWINPKTSILTKTVTFLSRDHLPIDNLPSEESWG